jgi:hypothetical protein
MVFNISSLHLASNCYCNQWSISSGTGKRFLLHISFVFNSQDYIFDRNHLGRIHDIDIGAGVGLFFAQITI